MLGALCVSAAPTVLRLSGCFLIPETYSPVLLQKRAKELRSLHPEMTELYAPLEHSDMSAKGLLKRVRARMPRQR